MTLVRAPLVPLAFMVLVGGLAAGCSGHDPIADAGMPDAGSMCTAPEEECGGLCVDTTTSTAHCGGCDDPCDPGDECIAGGCRAPCTAMAPDRCGVECIDTSTSNAHCGDCDDPCNPGYACTSGRCLPDCQGNLDGTVVMVTSVSVDPSSGAVGTVFQVSLRYTVVEPVEDLLITLIVQDLDGNVRSNVVLERTSVGAGDYLEPLQFDSGMSSPGFHRATATLCTPQGGDQNSATLRVN